MLGVPFDLNRYPNQLILEITLALFEQGVTDS